MNKNSGESTEYQVQQKLQGSLFTDSRNSNTYLFYLDEEMREPAYYRDLITTINQARPEDTVELHINHYGGRLDSAISIINAINICEGNVVGVLNCNAMSAHAMIFLSCKSTAVHPNSVLMLHNVAGGYGGNYAEMKNYIDFHAKYNAKIIKEVTSGFLTDSEIKNILETDATYYFDSEEIIKRLKKRQKLIKVSR